ncbi:MAG: hypothetical protein ACRDO4_14060 [Nocardioides sp.]
MKLAVVSGAVLAVLGAGGLAGAADRHEHEAEKAAKHDAQRAFVVAKQEWTSCVAEAAPAHRSGTGPFDPEEACGTKPHPHGEKGRGRSGDGRAHGPGRTPWAGGPGSRTAEPPGHAKRDEKRDEQRPRG